MWVEISGSKWSSEGEKHTFSDMGPELYEIFYIDIFLGDLKLVRNTWQKRIDDNFDPLASRIYYA